jgi:hypothetical protein
MRTDAWNSPGNAFIGKLPVSETEREGGREGGREEGEGGEREKGSEREREREGGRERVVYVCEMVKPGRI